MYEFLQEHNILFQNQFGFRKNNSTTFALIEITEKIKETIANKKYGCGIFIDLHKAFDTVNHDILLKKLEHWYQRNALKWFRSYLTNRKQYFPSMENALNLNKHITCGVPQGSCLGPLVPDLYK